MLADYIGCRILLLCSDSNRCTMTITAGYIKYTFSFCSEITGQNITRKEGSLNLLYLDIRFLSFLVVTLSCCAENCKIKKRSHPHTHIVQGTRAKNSRVTTLIHLFLTITSLIKFGQEMIHRNSIAVTGDPGVA